MNAPLPLSPARTVSRRDLLAAAALATLAPPAARSAPSTAAPGSKVLRVAFPTPEGGFDPVLHTDYYSSQAWAHIFESLFTHDPLASPTTIVPLTAAGDAEPSDDFRTWTVRLLPGILFHDHPAFGGRVRELTAEDYVFSFKRGADPQARGVSTWLEEAAPIGLADLVKQARDGSRGLDYDRPIPGLRALDRYTLQIRTEQPRPHLPLQLATTSTVAMAREVVQQHGESVGDHPVGTGPFRLANWRRGSLIVLERNPQYRERV